MEKKARSSSLHPTVKELVSKAKEEITWMVGRNYPDMYANEIAEQKLRIKDFRRLWRKYGETPLVSKMTAIVDVMVNHYHADFFLHDLRMMEKYQGRFAWFVGDCGTHMVWLDNENQKDEDNQRGWFDAICKSYGHYALYEGNTVKNTLQKELARNIEFKIVNPGRELVYATSL